MLKRDAGFLSLIAISSFVAACGGAPASDGAAAEGQVATNEPTGPAAPPASCTPLETREANAPEQSPAFTGQTRACGISSNVSFDVSVVATGLENPWSVEPLPGGDFLVTERPGRLRIVSGSGVVGEPIRGLPPVSAGGQGGLLDVALSPNFATDRMIFWTYSEPREGDANATSAARGVLSTDRRSLTDVRVIYRSLPAYPGRLHFGSRIVPGPDGKLYITMGERSDAPMRQYAQRMDSHLGKVVRINTDGTAPGDNPFADDRNAQKEIWTIGHRNVQAAAFDPEGRLWVVEHGTNGGDELNLIEKGRNYGWPLQAYGEEYSRREIEGAVTNLPQFQQPVYYWDPVIAPSGAQFYTGSAFPAWQGSLFVGSLRDMMLVRLQLQGDRVVGVEHLLEDRRQRIRDVRQGPDGALYLVTDAAAGELLRVAPRR